jgi:hypothetical protein
MNKRGWGHHMDAAVGPAIPALVDLREQRAIGAVDATASPAAVFGSV